MNSGLRSVLFVGWALALGSPPAHTTEAAAQQEYRVDLDADRTARFVSRTAIQRFNGVTDRIERLIYINTQSLSEDTGGADTELCFEVDLASFDTGLSLRDRHMRNNYLEVEDHPFAAFGGRIVRVDPLPGGGFRVTGPGVFGVHGVERDRSIDCDVTPASDGYRVSYGF